MSELTKAKNFIRSTDKPPNKLFNSKSEFKTIITEEQP